MTGKYKYLLLFLVLLGGRNIYCQQFDSLTLDSIKAFVSMDEALKNPEKVIKLKLRKQKLKTVPPEIFKFTNLQYLDLSKNKLKEIPADISKLNNLQVLILSSNSIELLPAEIGALKNLKILSANQNELTMLPPQVGDLVNIEYLDLWSNNLGSLPDEVKKLTKLKTLDLRAILLNINQQTQIKSLLPNTTIFFSPPCKCGL